MAIVGLSLRDINANFDESVVATDNINVNSSPTITNVSKRDIPLYNLKDLLSVEFVFKTTYEPKVGSISMEGEVLYQVDNAKEIVSKWKKDKQIEANLATEILNAIFRKCLTQAIMLAHELRLPPPIMFPVVQPRREDE